MPRTKLPWPGYVPERVGGGWREAIAKAASPFRATSLSRSDVDGYFKNNKWRDVLEARPGEGTRPVRLEGVGIVAWVGLTDQRYETIEGMVWPCHAGPFGKSRRPSLVRAESEEDYRRGRTRILISMSPCALGDQSCASNRIVHDRFARGRPVIRRRDQDLFFSATIDAPRAGIFRVLAGDPDDDGLTDLLVVLSNGAGILFSQDVALCRENSKPLKPSSSKNTSR
jgi:hypothetical protein